MPESVENRYTLVAIILHWLIAFSIIGMIGLGWYMGDLEDRAQQYELTQLHKSLGITILLLSIARVVWRLMNPPPAAPPMPAWQANASKATHIAFYVLIIAMPLTGWIMASASPTEIPTRLFGAIAWPHLPGLPNLSADAKEAFHVPIEFAHSKLAWVAIALLVLHVGAALKHQFVDKDGLLARMAPGLFGKTSGPAQPARGGLTAFGAALAIFAVAAAAPMLAGDPEPASEAALSDATPAPVEQPAPEPEPQPLATAEAPEPEPEPEQTPAPATEPQPAATAGLESQDLSPEPAQPVAPAADAAIPTWAIDHGSSSLGFTAGYMGREFSGVFDTWTADIAFDPERPEQADIRVEISMASVNTGEPFYDDNVVLGDWFDAQNHPQAVFTADSAASVGGERFRADGQLTIKGSSRPLALTFTLTIDGDGAEVQGEATIQRLDFDIGSDTLTEPRGDEDWVANDIRITFDLTAARE